MQQWPSITSGDTNFFEDLSATVQEELQKERTKATTSTHSQVRDMHLLCEFLKTNFVY